MITAVTSTMVRQYLKTLLTFDSNIHLGASLSTIPAGHVLDAMCFLLGEFAFVNATAKVNFPDLKTPLHTSTPPTRTAYDSFSVVGDLESGTSVAFQMLSSTSGINSLTWVITGEQGSLKFEGDAVNVQTDAPKLFQWQKSEEPSTGIYEKLEAPIEEWIVVEVAPTIAYGQIGEIYEAFANGEKVKGSLVDFEGAALRHRMLEACYKSARDGTRETYRK
jgi:predicted dehydrogenase